MRYKYLVVVLTAVLILWAGPLLPQSAANPPDNLLGVDAQSQQPITITSNRAELDNKQHTAVHRGNVVVKRGELTLYSNEIKAWFDGETKRIKQIDARGGVRLVHLNRVITAEAGAYFDEQQKIVLTGNPVCQEGDNVLAGSRITYFMNEDRIVVEDAKSILQPGNTSDGETQKPER
jgi:lipopolysaccharide export system protein LptA